MPEQSTTVLIVGGGLSGLSSALFLAHQDVDCILIERHRGHSTNPRLSGLFPRAMEVFDQFGVGEHIRALDEFDGDNGRFLVAETLAGAEIADNPDVQQSEDLSSVIGSHQVICDQDQVEPVLRTHATTAGADIRFNTELVSFEQRNDGVRAIISDRQSGQETTVQADYLLACDGQRSPIREQLGIQRRGPGTLGGMASVLFRADLSDALRGRHIRICVTKQPVGGANLHVRSQGRWQFGFQFDPNVDQVDDYTQQRYAEMIRASVGLPELEVNILDIGSWDIAAVVANSYQRDHVFLVGDSAHVMPPTGGFGGHSCILDAHNLAWKIAAIHHGSASPALLATYQDERQPVDELAMIDSGARATWFMNQDQPTAQRPSPEDHLTVAMGYRYDSDAICSDTPDAGLTEDPRHPTGAPGTRAPHLIVRHDGRTMSLHDLLGPRLCLLVGPQGHQWVNASHETGVQPRPPIQTFHLGSDVVDVEQRWASRYHVTDAGAVLIRPDGHVAWRSATGPGHGAAEELGSALNAVLGVSQ